MKYRDNGGYALGEPIAIESGSPDFSDCNVKNYELKMGYDAAFTCFSSYAFSSNDCEARRNAIITVGATLFYAKPDQIIHVGVELDAVLKCSMEHDI